MSTLNLPINTYRLEFDCYGKFISEATWKDCVRQQEADRAEPAARQFSYHHGWQ